MFYIKTEEKKYVKQLDDQENEILVDTIEEALGFETREAAREYANICYYDCYDAVDIVESMSKDEFIKKVKELLIDIEFSNQESYIDYSEDYELENSVTVYNICPYCGKEMSHDKLCLLNQLLKVEVI
jgi:hypothetical protein